jgi:UDP-N-acetylmuramate dehydrogenase
MAVIILQNQSLKPYNTFGISATASYFAEINTIKQLQDVLQSKTAIDNNVVILGGGSNVLLTQHVDALVIKNNLLGKNIIAETDTTITVEAAAGEPWHQFVLWTIAQGFNGLENLSLIPGTVGAAPMQNIGAYGVEIKDTVTAVTALHLATKQLHTFTNADCKFGYRESVFKAALKNQYIITSVQFTFNKLASINTSYGDIQKILDAKNISTPTAKDISDAVIQIRQSKLPDPDVIGNAGSFFKNPTIALDAYQQLQTTYPTMPGYVVTPDTIKVPAGWLIEQCGWKGFREQDYGVHHLQALVIINFGNATGQQIYDCSQRIIDSVHNKFGILLHREVNIW